MNRTLTCIAAALLLATSGAQAQKALPNPLMQPPKRGQQDPEAQAAASASAAAGAKEASKEAESIPNDLMGKVGSLFVSAIIGDVAVLRTSPGASTASSGSSSGANPPGQDRPQSGAATSSGRASVYYVRDAEPFNLFDRYRLLPRIQDATVVLYLMPENPQDMAKRPQVVFRASLESQHSTPYVPSKVEPVGGGTDGTAYQQLIQTGAGGASGGKGGANLGINAPKSP